MIDVVSVKHDPIEQGFNEIFKNDPKVREDARKYFKLTQEWNKLIDRCVDAAFEENWKLRDKLIARADAIEKEWMKIRRKYDPTM